MNEKKYVTRRMTKDDLTEQDFEFYKLYQKWYYTTVHNSVNHFEVGDIVRIASCLDHDSGHSGMLGIVIGLSGVNNYLYVISYDKRASRYWSCGFQENLIKKTTTYSQKDYELVYEAYKDWLWRNDFNLCTAHFRYHWEKYRRRQHLKIIKPKRKIFKLNNDTKVVSKKNEYEQWQRKKLYIILFITLTATIIWTCWYLYNGLFK